MEHSDLVMQYEVVGQALYISGLCRDVRFLLYLFLMFAEKKKILIISIVQAENTSYKV